MISSYKIIYAPNEFVYSPPNRRLILFQLPLYFSEFGSKYVVNGLKTRKTK